jgi:hypothetical protein
MTAPVASGWSGCRVGLAPTGKRRLSTAHTQCRLRDLKGNRAIVILSRLDHAVVMRQIAYCRVTSIIL